MIKQFADKVTADIYHGASSKYARKIPKELHPKARRLLDQLNASPTLGFLRIPPGNRLEKMSGAKLCYPKTEPQPTREKCC